MKFTCTVEIEKPKELMARMFADPALQKEYQDGFISKELVAGTTGQKGAISLMKYRQGKGIMELTETILENDLPDRFKGYYHHKHMDNTMTCTFTSLDPERTRYESEIEYTAFRGFLPKMLARLFPGMFKKQVQKWLNNFKALVENH